LTQLYVGINYSGLHDSSVAILNSKGEIELALSFERISRVKQDGRFPKIIINQIDWGNVKSCTFSVEDKSHGKYEKRSAFLKNSREIGGNSSTGPFPHRNIFYEQISQTPFDLSFLCHQRAHAASSVWSSPFDSALALSYDAGTYNCGNFGGVYLFDRKSGLKLVENFADAYFQRITALYSFMTAFLGFTPNKHEGKLTGMAGSIHENLECTNELQYLFEKHYEDIVRALVWRGEYSSDQSPRLSLNLFRATKLVYLHSKYSSEQLAKSTQVISERYIDSLIDAIQKEFPKQKNLCVSGGLFSNVSINNLIASKVSGDLFVAPFMTDDGTALGAAYESYFAETAGEIKPIENVFFGFEYPNELVEKLLFEMKLPYATITNEAEYIAEQLYKRKIVARFDGKSEFGPRALGNRSILAANVDDRVIQVLNEKLGRSEFMPFAPALLEKNRNYLTSDRVHPSDYFMTRTVNCHPGISSPLVHHDGTARPQFVRAQDSGLFAILDRLDYQYGIQMVLNTSFNLHEEPIVESPKDAIITFLRSGIDFLVINRKYVLERLDVKDALFRDSGKLQGRIKHILEDFGADYVEEQIRFNLQGK
jgi:carbamoyltransferase